LTQRPRFCLALPVHATLALGLVGGAIFGQRARGRTRRSGVRRQDEQSRLGAKVTGEARWRSLTAKPRLEAHERSPHAKPHRPQGRSQGKMRAETDEDRATKAQRRRCETEGRTTGPPEATTVETYNSLGWELAYIPVFQPT